MGWLIETMRGNLLSKRAFYCTSMDYSRVIIMKAMNAFLETTVLLRKQAFKLAANILPQSKIFLGSASTQG